jgi:hypothetical protein
VVPGALPGDQNQPCGLPGDVRKRVQEKYH